MEEVQDGAGPLLGVVEDILFPPSLILMILESGNKSSSNNQNQFLEQLSFDLNGSLLDTASTNISPPFWTVEQLELLETIPRSLHIVLGVIATCIIVFGIGANTVILYVFFRFKRLRTPANVFVINLTISDLCSCLIHPLTAFSAFNGRWAFGSLGCNLYAMGICFFGLITIITLSAIAFERYFVITAKPATTKWRISRRQSQRVCLFIWLYCAMLTTPPWILGWSRYIPEGVLVSCSWDYTTRTLSNRLYYIYLLILGFVLPVTLLVFCYSAIIRFIVVHDREMNRIMLTTNSKKRKQTDVRTAQIILMLAILYLTAWTPYAIVSMIGQFGPLTEDGKSFLGPVATTIPAFLAKTCVLFDPIVYGFSHPQFRSSVRQMLQHSYETSTLRINFQNMFQDSTPRSQRASRQQSKSSNKTSSQRSLQQSPKSRGSSRSRAMALPETFTLESPNDKVQGTSRRTRYYDSGSKRNIGRDQSQKKDNLSVPPRSQLSVDVHKQEESEYRLFRQNQRSSEKLSAVGNRQQPQFHPSLGVLRKYNHHSSEPDLLRCSSRIIENAPSLAWDEYRRKRQELLRGVFFRSTSDLHQQEKMPSTVSISKNGSVRSAVLKVDESPPTVCSVMIHHQQEQQQSSSSRNITRHHSLSSSKSRISSIAESSSFGGSRQRQPNRKKQKRHGGRSECAYGPLRQTVTLSQVEGPEGRKHWRACMVNGRDALSNSLDSL